MILYRPNKVIKLFHPGAVWNCEQEGVLITIDDGPTREGTMRIIEVLEEIGCKAVFFLSGDQIRGKEEILIEIIKNGHKIGNHGFHHRKITFMGREELRRSIASTNDLVRSITGEEVLFYRSPYGSPSVFLKSILNELGMRNIMWSLLTFDFRGSMEKSRTILSTYVKKGDIIVFHNNLLAASVFPEILTYLKTLIQEREISFLEPQCLN